MYPELEALSEFSSVQHRRFEIPMNYSTAAYTGWLSTDSLVNTLDDQARRGFLHDIEQLIDTKYNGTVSRNFVYELITAQRARQGN